jgi:hypothetical protein
MSANPPLRRIHSDQTIETGPSRFSLDYWRKQPTDAIIKSLQPGEREALRVKPDGRVMNGNTRIKVLEERGVDVNGLPRELMQ